MKNAPKDEDFVGPQVFRCCTTCGESKTLHLFTRNGRALMGRLHRCKACDAEAARQWRLNNLEQSRESARKQAAKNYDRVKERNKAWYAANKDRADEYKRAYVERNREKVANGLKAWHEANPDKAKEYAERAKAKAAAEREAALAFNVPIPDDVLAELRERKKVAYQAMWREENPEKMAAYGKAWRERNLERCRERSRDYAAERRKDPEFLRKMRENVAQWRLDNPGRAALASKVWYENNKERALAGSKAWRVRNLEMCKARDKAYAERNKDRRKLLADAWRRKNHEKVASRRFARRGRKPGWVYWIDLFPFKGAARRATKETGIPHEIDHIYPLVSPYVCGLDCPENLRIVTQFVNRSKGNKISSTVLHEMWEVPQEHIFWEEACTTS